MSNTRRKPMVFDANGPNVYSSQPCPDPAALNRQRQQEFWALAKWDDRVMKALNRAREEYIAAGSPPMPLTSYNYRATFFAEQAAPKPEPEQASGIDSDGSTVWVHSAKDGSCIGRFSRFGVDVHNTADAMIAGAPQCLECSHDLGYWDSWQSFKKAMIKHHGVWVPDSVMPGFVKVDMKLSSRTVLTVTDPGVLSIFGWDMCGDEPRAEDDYPSYVAAAYGLWEHWYKQRMLRDRRTEPDNVIKHTVQYLLTGKIG